MIDRRLKKDCRRRIRIVVRKLERELQSQPFVGCLCRARDRGSPEEQVTVCVGEGRDSGGGGEHELH